MLLDNKNNGHVGKELKKHSFEGSKLAVLSSLFTIYGFAALKKELGKLSDSRLLLTDWQHQTLQSLFGTEAEVRLNNQLNQRRIARECAKWITRDTGNWEPWLLYMIEGVSQTARNSTRLIGALQQLMNGCETRVRGALPKIYIYELVTNLFRHPYTKIEAVQSDLGVSRLTTSKYLDELVGAGFLHKRKFGKHNCYVNGDLVRLLEGSQQY